MSKSFKELLTAAFVLFLLMNLIQSENLLQHLKSSIKYLVFVFINIVFISYWAIASIKNFINKQGFFYIIVQKYKSLSIPKGAKIATVVVFFVNLLAISFAKQYYPFYDVGMFRWSSKVSQQDKIVYQPKYYYKKNGKNIILDLRKEGSFFLAEHFGWGYTNEFTFAATFHNKGKKENFEFLSKEMKKRGVDTLWVGIHSVNYETKEVKFDTNICHAILINSNMKIYYGPIFIPSYQINKCNEN